MSNPFIGQIILFAGTYAPRGWAFCNGQTLGIAQYQALFAILGTTYGGDGRTNFALPDLRSRVPLHPGQGQGLSAYTLGQKVGAESVTLTVQQMPAHTHGLQGDAKSGTVASPSAANLAQTVSTDRAATPANAYTSGAATAPVQLAPTSIQPAGNSQAHTNVQPVLALNFIIALEGVFPSRN